MAKQKPEDTELTASNTDLDSVKTELDQANAKIEELTASNTDLDSVKTELDQANAKIEELTASNSELIKAAKKWGIITVEQAKDHVSKNYVPGDKVRLIMVTQDGNVFYDGDIAGSGVAHAQQKEILSFTFANTQ